MKICFCRKAYFLLKIYVLNTLKYFYFQSETIHDVMIDKPSIYRIILRYISLNNQAVSGEISLSPESSNDSEQKFEVRVLEYFCAKLRKNLL